MRNIRIVMQDPVNRWLWWVGVVVNAATWVAIWQFVPKNSAVLPLHYTIYFGINLTGSWVKLFWVSAVGVGILFAHLLMASTNTHRTWQRLWIILALTLNVLFVVDMVASILFIRYSL